METYVVTEVSEEYDRLCNRKAHVVIEGTLGARPSKWTKSRLIEGDRKGSGSNLDLMLNLLERINIFAAN